MNYVQVMIRDLEPSLPGPDDPIKHPCGPPHFPEALRALGAKTVSAPTPIFFIEDDTVWAKITKRALADGTTVEKVLTDALKGYLGP